MKKLVSLFLMSLLLVLAVGVVSADTRPLNVAIGYEQALNLGDPDAAAALFAEDAVFVNLIGGEEIVGRAAIRETLAGQARPGRSFDTVSVQMSGNELTLVVDIADRGITWGRQTLRAIVEDGQIRSMETVAFRILF